MVSPYGSRFDGAAWPWTCDVNGDWCVLYASDGRYVSDACVEGTRLEFSQLARSLRSGVDFKARRCAATKVERVWQFCSPRNTCGGSADLPVHRAGELADIIEQAIAQEAA